MSVPSVRPFRKAGPDQAIATELAKLWPNREHESSAVAGLLCRIGVHRWRSLDVSKVAPNKEVRFCFWCSVVKVDGNIYTP